MTEYSLDLMQIEEHALEVQMRLGIMLYRRYKQYSISRDSDKLCDFPEFIDHVRRITGYSDAEISRVADFSPSFLWLLRKRGTRTRSHKKYARFLERLHFQFFTQNRRKTWELNPDKFRQLEELELAISSPDTLAMRKYIE